MKIIFSTVSTLVWLCIAEQVGAQDKHDIIAICREGYIQSRSTIQTLSCTVDIESTAWQGLNPNSGKRMEFPASIQRLSWLEERDVALARHTVNQAITFEYSWNNGILKHLKTTTQDDNEKTLAGRVDGPDGIAHVLTPWYLALMTRVNIFQDEMKDERVSAAVLVNLHDQPCYQLTIRKDDWRKDLWFDIKHHFLIRKSVFYPKADAGPANNVREVNTFIEHKPGIFFPGSVKMLVMDGDKVVQQETSTFSDVRINEHFDPSQLELRFPPGTKVTDTRKGTYYVVGDNEQPVGAVQTVANTVNTEIQLPTGLEATSYRTYWIVGASLVAILGLLFAIYLRRKAQTLDA